MKGATELEALIQQLQDGDKRLEGELSPADAKRQLMAAWVLIGMRVGRSKLQFAAWSEPRGFGLRTTTRPLAHRHENGFKGVLVSDMGWATAYIQKLREGETVTVRPRGNSMAGFNNISVAALVEGGIVPVQTADYHGPRDDWQILSPLAG